MGSVQSCAINGGVPGNRSASLFSRRAHLLTTSSSQSPFSSVSALRQKLRTLPCSSSPHKAGFAGAPSAVVFPAETVRSARRMRLLREPYGHCHIPSGCCHCPRSRQGTSNWEAPYMGGQFAHPCCHLPAKICHWQFYRSYGCVMFCDAPIFFFAKKKKKKGW